MSTLVIGGTGNVGREVVANLLARRESVLVLVPNQAEAQRVLPGARSILGDLRDPRSLQAAFREAKRAFLLVAQTPDEPQQGLNAVAAAKTAGLQRLVYMSVGMPHFADRIPHFASKKPIEEAVRRSGIPYTILRPNNFFQNDLLLSDAIVGQGLYPQPIGSVGISRVDTRDIGEAAAIALTGEGHAGQIYNLHGPEVLTGAAVADTYAKHLRRPVVYAGDDLDLWSAAASQALPAWLVSDLRIMYALYQEYGMKGDDEDLRRLTQLLGRAPRRFDAFAAETAAMWRKAA